MSEYLVTGEDGGKLTITQSVPPVYLINGGVVNEAAAYAWIRHWHAVRDNAIHADPPLSCICEPCQKTRELHR